MANQLAQIKKMIYDIRGQKVMIDRDLAELYGVEIKVMNQTVKRNIDRFPPDFMFQLTNEEWQNQRSQFVTFSQDTRKYKPFAFTEHGILMLSSVLNSARAIEINIQIMRVFVKMRHYVLSKSDKNQTDRLWCKLRLFNGWERKRQQQSLFYGGVAENNMNKNFTTNDTNKHKRRGMGRGGL